MSAPSTPVAPGVQILLDAEKEASRQIQQARQYRIQRLKDARTEAQNEIEALKESKLAEFQEYEKMILGTFDEVVAECAADTQTKLEEVSRIAREKGAEAVKMLVDAVLNVHEK